MKPLPLLRGSLIMSNLVIKLKNLLFSVTASQVVAGMLGAVLILGITQIAVVKPERIATVNVTFLVNRFIQSQTKLNLPPKELQKRVNDFGRQLQTTLDKVAQKRHVILMMQEAAVAGTEDLTPVVEKQLMQSQDE